MEEKDRDFACVTEIAGDEVTREQVERLCNRYYWAGRYCRDKDVLEAACGPGQGAGYLNTIGKSFEAGDCDPFIFSIACKHYGQRINLRQFDAQDMPYKDNSKDLIILFEAIYYIPVTGKFIEECARILRPEGKVLVATANKDLYDFNPSPHSHIYYGVVELGDLLKQYGFKAEFFGDTPVGEVSITQKILRPAKKLAVTFNLIPKSMGAKKFLKRIVFGRLVKMPAEITADTAEYVEPVPIPSDVPDKKHKVIYCAATLKP